MIFEDPFFLYMIYSLSEYFQSVSYINGCGLQLKLWFHVVFFLTEIQFDLCDLLISLGDVLLSRWLT